MLAEAAAEAAETIDIQHSREPVQRQLAFVVPIMQECENWDILQA